MRRGLDPVEVHAFLHRVAGDLALARREVARTAEENVRIKRALRNWQSRFTPGARGFARSICRTLGFLADVERGGTTVSREDEQSVRHWVWCDRVLDGGRRCPLPADHDGACGPLRRR
ncbi:hypothetical protein EFE23_07595 [Micromonospora solifontis]|uniref:DivIVA domain-containing protein n=1 Tax=Micromonospora solifontis TaxID=2487138 RepID=A0ABX9WIV2_9ACTN|nr:hypothetical protein EFE23_07595 [Micromonospora solifontis]